jgi:hypothetical protein
LIFAKLLAVIAVWFCALQVWDIATLHFTDLLRSPAAVLRFLAGCVLAFGALVLLYVAVPFSAPGLFSAIAIATFVGALLAEFLIGDDLRSALRAATRR